MTEAEFAKLLAHPESGWLDWKGEFPSGLANRAQDPGGYEDARGELLKDLLALANGEDDVRAYLVYGVVDQGASRFVRGIQRPWDDATFQSWNRTVFDPPISFTQSTVPFAEKQVAVFEIQRTVERPHVPVTSIGRKLAEGQVWFRRGTQNQVAHRTELEAMLRPRAPLVFAGTLLREVQEFESLIRRAGQEPCYPFLAERERYIREGYRPYTTPDTSQEVHIGVRTSDRTILMVKPRA